MADGAADLVQWVSARLGMERDTAGEVVRVARALGDLPVTGRTLAEGVLSFDQVKHPVRVATVDSEERLVDDARGLALDQLARRRCRLGDGAPGIGCSVGGRHAAPVGL